jgi:hypothetical protein
MVKWFEWKYVTATQKALAEMRLVWAPNEGTRNVLRRPFAVLRSVIPTPTRSASGWEYGDVKHIHTLAVPTFLIPGVGTL